MLATEKVGLLQRHKIVTEIMKQLDPTNIKILSTMWETGPRNLLEVSRKTGIPFTSVYHRVGKIEAKSKRLATVIPQVSKLGMVRIALFTAARPGSEESVTTALKIPNLWRSVNRCEGAFTHVSIHVVPVQFMKHFRTYLKRLSESGLIKQSKMFLTGEYIPNFPAFKYYDPSSNQWTFDWERWLNALKRDPTKTIEDPESYAMLADEKDLLIIKELEKNARQSFAEIAPLMGISLQGVKYHYDKKLVPSEIVKYVGYDVWPYPEEVSAYHEIFLKFTSTIEMNRFYSLVRELFFVLGVSKVLHENSLIVRTYTLQNQVWSMFSFFSQMAKEGIIESYSSVRQDFSGRETQSISFELFDSEKGWTFDLDNCLSDLAKLTQLVPAVQKV
ncbi:MAG: winged helix-turn-helix transcriptional regulator [Candidatus Bathyarchaeia archaeon]|jgi:DNA-binding Lrp family transcriptional regulator